MDCETPNDHDLIIDDFNWIVCKKCKKQWMELTPAIKNTELLK